METQFLRDNNFTTILTSFSQGIDAGQYVLLVLWFSIKSTHMKEIVLKLRVL